MSDQIKKPIVGITGGIGAGKSIIRKCFEQLGVDCYDADQRAKIVMVKNKKLKQALIEAFGSATYLEDGSLNRSYLAKLVFNDQSKTVQINALVHPAVATDFDAWLIQTQSTYVIKEAALLIESKGYLKLDHLINVVAPKDMRMARVLQRDPQRSRFQIEAIMDKQMSDEERSKYSQTIILNDNNALLIPEILALHQQFNEGNY